MSLKARRCLIVGGGRVALRKIDTLLNYETDITVIAPEADERIEYYASKNLLLRKTSLPHPGRTIAPEYWILPVPGHLNLLSSKILYTYNFRK